LQIDVAIFLQWLDARAEGRSELADFYRARFRAEFGPAFTIWLATDPIGSGAAPPSPFVMPQYRLKADTRARRLEGVAAADAEQHVILGLGCLVFLAAVIWMATFPAQLTT
jgi:hypothetical protein